MSKSTIAIHLPDGAVREVPAGTTPLEIANSISPRLAAVSVVARLTPLTANGTAGGAQASEAGRAGMCPPAHKTAPRPGGFAEPLSEGANRSPGCQTDA